MFFTGVNEFKEFINTSIRPFLLSRNSDIAIIELDPEGCIEIGLVGACCENDKEKMEIVNYIKRLVVQNISAVMDFKVIVNN